VCNKKTDPSVYEHKLAIKSDSIQQLLMDKDNLIKTQKDSIKYVVKQGDMLYSLGQLFFNDNKAGYQIGKDNGFTTENQYKKLVIGDTLTIHFR
jgi:hypothetical protein